VFEENMPSNALFCILLVTFLRFACQATEYANVENEFLRLIIRVQK